MARNVDYLINSLEGDAPKKSLEYYLEGASSATCPDKAVLFNDRFKEFQRDVIEQFGPNHLTSEQHDYIFEYVRRNNGLSHYEIFAGYKAMSEFLVGLNLLSMKVNE